MRVNPRFLDTNVLLRLLTADDPDKAQQALALLLRVERGEERLLTSPMVIFETIFTLQKSYGVPREQIRDLVRPILMLRGLDLADRAIFGHALDLFTERALSFADAFNTAFMAGRGVTDVYSWDTDFDRISGVNRLDPG